MVNEGRRLGYLEAIAEGLVQAMEKDDSVFLIGEGVDSIKGVYGVTLPAYERFGAKRVIDTPLSENGLTGFAIGAAMDGLRPVLFHQRNDFMMLTMDQLVNHAAKIPYISAGKHRVPLTIVSFVARKSGEGAQHSQSLQSLFAHVPGLKVIMPTTPYDAKGLLLSAIDDDSPVIILYHWTKIEADVPRVAYEVPLGNSRVARLGADVTVISVSAATIDTLMAADELSDEGIEAEVIDLRSIRPINEKIILESVKKTGHLVVVDTGWKHFSVSSEIIALVSEKAFQFLKASPRRVGMADTPAPAAPQLLTNYHPSKESIINVIREIVG